MFLELAQPSQFVLVPFGDPGHLFTVRSLAPHQTEELSSAVLSRPSGFHSYKEGKNQNRNKQLLM